MLTKSHPPSMEAEAEGERKTKRKRERERDFYALQTG